jgi:hypothetical protein
VCFSGSYLVGTVGLRVSSRNLGDFFLPSVGSSFITISACSLAVNTVYQGTVEYRRKDKLTEYIKLMLFYFYM